MVSCIMSDSVASYYNVGDAVESGGVEDSVDSGARGDDSPAPWSEYVSEGRSDAPDCMADD